MVPRRASQRLVSVHTLLAGEILPQLPERAAAPWAVLPPHQRQAV
jgi:hypothetical protein